MLVTKRNGEKQELDLNKIHKVLTWACEGYGDDSLKPIHGVSVSQIEMKAELHFHEGVATKNIHEILIKAAADLISKETPNYDQVAARLIWFAVRKIAFDKNVPPSLLEVITTNVEKKLYDAAILKNYTTEEINKIDAFVDHTRDDLFKYAGAEQMRKKYLVQNRKTKKVFESFQHPYILISMILFANYDKSIRLQYVKDYYDAISQHDISLPTPIMAGLRTKTKQFASCTVVDSGDSLPSIIATGGSIMKYAAKKAGLGVNIGRIRGEGQLIRNGEAISTGVLPFAKFFNGALKSCSQGAIRGASATFNFPFWHIEYERLIELKNNKGTEETRLRTVDYSIHLHGLFYERVAQGKSITLFSPDEVPDLYDAFYSQNPEHFKELYEKYEKAPVKSKKTLPAMDMLTKILEERFGTGRIYIMHADHMNTHSSFYENIVTSNLCQEIALPTTPVTTEEDEDYDSDKSLIALCILSALNWGKFTPFSLLNEQQALKQEAKIKKIADLAVRALDALMDYQEYPVAAAERHTKLYRPMAVGVIGFSHFLAKGKLFWGTKKANQDVEEVMEKVAYYLTDASINLAQEFGALKIKTKYSEGIFPIDTSYIKANTKMDWEALRVKVKKHGIRNATLMALMPSETSSQLANETNGIEPPRDLVSIKGSKDGVLPQVVPEIKKLEPYYETLWQVSASDYLQTVAVLQKYVDQAISVNTSYDVSRDDIKMSTLIEDLILSWKLGHKTLYYCNTRDSDDVEDQAEEDCDSCKI